jgi:aspartyl protease family protein
MATGFMTRHCIALLLLLASAWAAAADVALIGTFESKAAILSIDRGAPKTVKAGQSFGGVTVISVERDKAVVEIDGKRMLLVRGQASFATGGGAGRGQSVTLIADTGGHYTADGAINGVPMRFVVDTGATVVTLPGSDAERLGIDYRSRPSGIAQTAGGATLVYHIKLDTIRVGGIELNSVDAIVIDKGLQVALLGMSFLNRVDLRHTDGQMTITRRY